MNFIDQQVENYAYNHTRAEPELLQALAAETREKMPDSVMLTGRLEGRMLKMLVIISGAKKVLEIGMFTGYSALSMAEALPEDGNIITCEIDRRAKAMAEKYFQQSQYGHKIEIRMGPALDTINKLNMTFDLVFIDADKENYVNYYDSVLPKVRSGGLIVVDNALWSGKVLNPQDKETQTIANLNKKIVQDERVENVLLTIRDGVNVVRKK